MKNSHQHSILVQRGKTRRKTDKIILKNNPKIDRRLLEEYERSIAPMRDFFPAKQGTDYHLSHPFGSNDVPTDPREIGKRLSDVKRT